MKRIESRENQIFKNALKVSRGNSSDSSAIIVEGKKLIREALDSGATVLQVFISDPSAMEDFPDLERQCCIITKSLFKELSSVQTQAQIIALFAPPAPADIEKFLSSSSAIVVLDRLQDPGNMGTIIRTSEAMGVEGIILLKGCCSPYNTKVIRAAMGSSFRLPMCVNVDPCQLLSDLKRHGFASICADMNGTSLFAYRFPAKCALFFGQEGQGLDTKILKECTDRLAIPMQGRVESLNVAASAAVCLYELAKCRSIKN